MTSLLNGIKVVLYPSPLHYRQIPKLIAGTNPPSSSPPIRSCRAIHGPPIRTIFRSVRYVIAGAERVKDDTRKLWERHGTVILEGYGATECSPVVACSLPDRNRHGSVGPLLPGIEWRLEPVEGIHEGGRLSVRGPNVMRGYLDPEAPGGIDPPEDGWHDMGDIVSVDDGMVRILGRAKRFAKVGGEMISLAAIETVAQSLWPKFNHVVVALPDPRKGEQVVLITDKPEADRDALMNHAREQGFPELWVPKAILVTAAVPVMGNGKVDFVATQELARNMRPLL